LTLNWKTNYWIKETKENRWKLVGASYSTGEYWLNFFREGTDVALRVEEYSDAVWKVKIGKQGGGKYFNVTSKTKTLSFPDKQSATDFAEAYMRDNP